MDQVECIKIRPRKNTVKTNRKTIRFQDVGHNVPPEIRSYPQDDVA
jgi:hypothetical protein